MSTLDEILSNNTEYGDDLKFVSAKGTEIPVGELRKFASQLRDSVDRETNEAKRLSTDAQNKRREAEDLAQKATLLLQQLNEIQNQVSASDARKTPDTTPSDWKSDPLYGPLVPVLAELAAKIAQFETESKGARDALQTMQAVYGLRELERQWAGYEPQLKGKNLTFDQVAQMAVARKAVDRWGVPTLAPIVEELTRADREAAIRSEERAKADKEWGAKLDAATRAASVPRPGGSVFRVETKSKAPVSKIEELTSDKIAGDEDIQKIMRGEPVQ